MKYIHKLYKSNVPNIDKSITKALSESAIKYSERVSGMDILAENQLYAWDFGVRIFQHIEIGDIVSFSTKSQFIQGKVCLKFNDPNGKFCDMVQWREAFDTKWTHPIIFDSIIVKNLPRYPDIYEFCENEGDFISKNCYQFNDNIYDSLFKKNDIKPKVKPIEPVDPPVKSFWEKLFEKLKNLFK